MGSASPHPQELGEGHQGATGGHLGAPDADPLSGGLVFIQGSEAVTTSLAIAEGTKVEHRAVLQLARTYLDDLSEFGRVAFETRPFATTGGTQTREIALLNEQQAALVMSYMKNSTIVRTFKKGLIKAFWAMAAELRGRPAVDPMAVLRDPAAMRGLLLTYSEKVLTLENTVAEQAPKVAALDRIATADGSMCITNAAKHLQMRPKELFRWLSAHNWIFRRGGDWLGYQAKTSQGLLEHKVTTVERGDGSSMIREQVLVTAKGLAHLAQAVGEGRAA